MTQNKSQILTCMALMWLILISAVSNSAEDMTVTDINDNPADSIAIFMSENPNSLAYNIIYEGTKLYIASDGQDLMLILSVANPALQMRLLMQPMKLYIDPSGRKKKDYCVSMPCAMDVRDHIEAPKPQPGGMEQMRLDLMPMIDLLNRVGAKYRFGKKSTTLGFQRFCIDLNREDELINYYVRIPLDAMIRDKHLSDEWTIGVISENATQGMLPPDGMDGPMGGPAPEPELPDGDRKLHEVMQGNIKAWQKFPINDVINLNAK